MKYTNENLINVLANGLADTCAFASLDFEVREYQQAKKELNKIDLCYEEILVKMLEMGFKLSLQDCEGKWHNITLNKLLKGCRLYFKSGYATGCKNFDDLEENGDFYDNEAILQFAVFNEVICG